jgi:hypothetical protein
VTDHDTAEGALRLHEIAPSRIIVGEEIHTTSGEIIGLFLKETIQPWLSTMETIERIKDQGGLVFLPHPFDGLRGAVLDKHTRDEIYESIDIVEVYNSRNVFPWTNWKAAKFAAEKGILGGAGSDAHWGALTWLSNLLNLPTTFSQSLPTLRYAAGKPR